MNLQNQSQSLTLVKQVTLKKVCSKRLQSNSGMPGGTFVGAVFAGVVGDY